MTEEKKEEKKVEYVTKEELKEILKNVVEGIYKDISAAFNDFKTMINEIQKNQQALAQLSLQKQNPPNNNSQQQIDLTTLLQLMRFFMPQQDPLEKLKNKIFEKWLTRKDILERVNDKLMRKAIEKLLGEEAKEIFKEEEEEE